MKFEIAVVNYEKAELEFTQSLMCEVERLARLVIAQEPSIKGYCMAMGCACFSREYVEYENEGDTEGWEISDNPDPYEIDNLNAKALDKILNQWDRKFCITGYPMRLSIDHVTGEVNKYSDW